MMQFLSSTSTKFPAQMSLRRVNEATINCGLSQLKTGEGKDDGDDNLRVRFELHELPVLLSFMLPGKLAHGILRLSRTEIISCNKGEILPDFKHR